MEKKKCLFCGSDRYYAKGYCKNCYARTKYTGTPEYQERGQKVDCFSAESGEFLATYKSAASAARELGLSRSSITLCMQKKCSHVKGYLFKKSDGAYRYNENTEFKKSVIKEVCMYQDGNIIKTFKTVKEAAKFVGGSRQGIHQVINNKEKKYKGYTWTCVYELKSNTRKKEEVS